MSNINSRPGICRENYGLVNGYIDEETGETFEATPEPIHLGKGNYTTSMRCGCLHWVETDQAFRKRILEKE